MSIVSNIVKPIVSSIVKPIVRGVVTRYFTTLTPASLQHYTFPAWTAAGDFEIRFEFSSTAIAGALIIVGNNVDASAFVYLDGSTGSVICRAPNLVNITSSTGFNDGKLYSGVFKRTGVDLTLEISGILEGSNTGSVGNVVLHTIGKNAFGNYFNGITSDIGLNDIGGGDNRFYAIDENWVSDFNLIDSIGAQTGTAVNITSSDSKKYVFNGSASPNTWTMVDPPNDVIEIAGT